MKRLSGAKKQDELSMLEGYRQLVADTAQEQEALEWCEALCGDAFDAEEEPLRLAEHRTPHVIKLHQ